VDPSTGMAEVAGVRAETIRAWSQRSSQLREWAADNLVLVDGVQPTQAQLATAQKATRPKKPEELAWVQLQRSWREDARGLQFDHAGRDAARAARIAASRAPFDRARLADMAEKSTRRRSPAPTWWRSSARNCPSTPNSHRVRSLKSRWTRWRCG